MYRGAVRVPPTAERESDGESSPIIRIMDQTANEIRRSMGSSRSIGTQTESDNFTLRVPTPTGYAVPEAFIRSVCEAIGEGINVYCGRDCGEKERRNMFSKMLSDLNGYWDRKRNMRIEFENLEKFKIIKINIYDLIQNNVIQNCEIIPPNKSIIIPNVDFPPYEYVLVNDVSILRVPEVEVAFYGSDSEVLACSEAVPLDLFIAATSIKVVWTDGEGDTVYYSAYMTNDSIA